MELYGRQLEPLFSTLVDRGGVNGLRADGEAAERALRRAQLRSLTRDRVPMLTAV